MTQFVCENPKVISKKRLQMHYLAFLSLFIMIYHGAQFKLNTKQENCRTIYFPSQRYIHFKGVCVKLLKDVKKFITLNGLNCIRLQHDHIGENIYKA